MAAGLGFIEFSTGDVLSAAAANGYLASQTVMVFASAAARTSAIASPQEGMFSYLKDTNATQFYDGAAWTNLDTTGMVNPMTTTGDMIYSSSGSTPARLGIGSTGQVLTVAGGVPTWAAAAGGGKVLQVVSATTTTDFANNTTTYGDTGLTATITPASATSKVLVIVSQSYFVNKASGSDCYCKIKLVRASTDIVTNAYFGYTNAAGATAVGTMAVGSITYLDSPSTTSATTYKTQGAAGAASTNFSAQWSGNMTSTITLLEIGA
jgi:hypothetical protein